MDDGQSIDQDNTQTPTKLGTKQRVVGCAVIGVILIMGFLLILPVNRNAREAARRVQSINNLKNLALAQKNYCSQNDGHFAAPTLLNDKGEPVHGWVTQMLPFLDNSAIYARIDKSLPWDHANNQEYFKLRLYGFLSPGLELEKNEAGYVLSHYSMNSRLFPKGESLTEDYVSRADGLSKTIMMGEVQEGLMPWGAPGNARDPALGLKPSPKTMGVDVWDGVTIIGFADGRVTTLNNDIDPMILKALATPDGGETLPKDW
jgi:hypothetical protein